MIVCEAYWSLKMIHGLLKIKICIKTIKNTPHFGPEINKNSGTNPAPRLGKRLKIKTILILMPPINSQIILMSCVVTVLIASFISFFDKGCIK